MAVVRLFAVMLVMRMSLKSAVRNALSDTRFASPGDMPVLHVKFELTNEGEGKDGLAASQGGSCTVEEFSLQ